METHNFNNKISGKNSIVPNKQDILMKSLTDFFQNSDYIHEMLPIINGESKISLRLIDWFATNYCKKNYTVYQLKSDPNKRFKVYIDYKLKLKAYSKKRFDPFCRWERITIPYGEDKYIQTTIGQLNFFKWALENEVVDYIEDNYQAIDNDMNNRNSTSRRRSINNNQNQKTRKKREELSISASKSIKKEDIEIVVKFN